MNQQKERLLLLRDNGVINSDTYHSMSMFLDFLKEQHIIDDDDRLNIMVVHMSMALSRVQANESISAVDEDIKTEVMSHPYYTRALSFWENNAFLDVLTEGEKYYILANFCNIIKE